MKRRTIALVAVWTLPSVVLLKPLGATPTIVIAWPLTMMVSFRTFEFAPSRVVQ